MISRDYRIVYYLRDSQKFVFCPSFHPRVGNLKTNLGIWVLHWKSLGEQYNNQIDFTTLLFLFCLGFLVQGVKPWDA